MSTSRSILHELYLCVGKQCVLWGGSCDKTDLYEDIVHSNSVIENPCHSSWPSNTNTHTKKEKECFVPFEQMLLYKACLSSERVKVNVASSALYGNLVWSLDGMQTLDCRNEAGWLYFSLSLSSASCLSDYSSTFSSFLLFLAFHLQGIFQVWAMSRASVSCSPLLLIKFRLIHPFANKYDIRTLKSNFWLVPMRFSCGVL